MALKHWHTKRFKSNNSAIVCSFNYIMELIKNIELTYNIDNLKDIFLFDSSLSTLFKLFINIEMDKEVVKKNLLNLIEDKLHEEYDKSIENQ